VRVVIKENGKIINNVEVYATLPGTKLTKKMEAIRFSSNAKNEQNLNSHDWKFWLILPSQKYCSSIEKVNPNPNPQELVIDINRCQYGNN
jgi:hypothetical protein